MGVEGGGVEAIGLSPPRDELGTLHSGAALGLGGSLAVPAGLPLRGGGRVPACSAGVRRGGDELAVTEMLALPTWPSVHEREEESLRLRVELPE